jgi:hypothetical protein
MCPTCVHAHVTRHATRDLQLQALPPPRRRTSIQQASAHLAAGVYELALDDEGGCAQQLALARICWNGAAAAGMAACQMLQHQVRSAPHAHSRLTLRHRYVVVLAAVELLEAPCIAQQEGACG